MILHRLSIPLSLALTAVLAVGLAGCRSADQYKAEADEQVYTIIDNKWDDAFGSKANYKISDVEPDPNAIIIDSSVPLPPVLTLPQAVALATANNRDYQTQKEALYTSALDLGLERHNFENQFFGGVLSGYSKNDQSGDEVVFNEGNFGFNRLLSTGARVSTHVAVSWAEILLGNRLSGGVTPMLGFSVIQPLLRGSNRDIVLENLTQAERNTLYQLRAFNRYRQEFVVSVVTQYYLILQAHDAAENARKNYQTMLWLYRKTKLLTDAGRLPKFEADRAKSEALNALDTYVRQRKLHEQALDDYKIVLGVPAAARFTLDPAEIQQLRAAELPYPEFAEDEAVQTALQRRLDLVNVADFVVDAQRKVKVAEDALRAELNVGADIAELGRSGVDIGRQPRLDRGGRVMIDTGRPDPINDQVRAVIELDLPLERESEKNLYRKSLIALSQAQRNYELATDTTTLEVRRAYRDLKEAAERYRIQQESLAVAKDHFRRTYAMFQYGQASSRRLIDAQGDFHSAQDAATDALVDYTIATLNFYRDAGVMRVLPDGMWKVNAK